MGLLFAIIFACQASQVSCVDSGKLKAIISGREVVEKVSFCLGNNGLFFLDKKCHQTQQCKALEATKKKVDLGLLNSNVGTLSFKLCHYLGGHANLAKYWGSNRWNSIGICSFSDGSFIGTDHLYKAVRRGL